ncbi:hypothetical protein M408DRAFT_282067 [Serendipita vermifera MAFF 305830]|uniref:Cytochrome P450 n=1 Tax=Serendipita vermifera MAFF 305830 TaxID=933852 RepID=A0A0C2WZD5_SERVB|nr:hypothetical protein M408DRAFT_282067 [Serendipita vermifera MAFF 305830]
MEAALEKSTKIMEYFLSSWQLQVVSCVVVGAGVVRYITQPKVPSYGGVFSFSRVLSLVRMVNSGRQEFLRAYAEDPMITLPRFDTWVVVAHSKYIDELNRAPDDVLSFMDSATDLIQMRYTFGHKLADNPYHVKVIINHLTKNLASTFVEVYDETEAAISDYIGPGNDWVTLNTMDFIQDVVARASNRVFIGLPVCRDKAWIDLNINGAMDALKVSLIINLFPPMLRPIVGNLVSSADKRARTAAKIAGKYLEERVTQPEAERPNDFISWLLAYAPPDEHNAKDIAARIISVNFAAIHTSSMNVTHAIYWLLARPQYIEPLREEIVEVTEKHGWTKEAIGTMPKLDSFMKECMRVCPPGSDVMSRKALKPYTFSNGVHIPKGHVVAAHLYATHFDEENYENPNTFDGFRFVEKKEEGEDGEKAAPTKSKKTMYTTSRTYLSFGHGKHACPGRFFASMEVKLILAHLLYEYEMKWPKEVYEGPNAHGIAGGEEGGYRPPDLWIAGNLSPNRDAKIMVRRRADI